MHIKLFLEGSTEGKASRGKNCETTHNAMQLNDEHIGNGNGSIYWTQTLESHESKQKRSYMFSAGSASFLITCTVLSVLLPPTPEHKARPSFGFSPGLGSLHLGHPYKMFCFVHLTLSECHLSLTTRPTVVVDLIFLPFCCFGFAAVIQFGDPY